MTGCCRIYFVDRVAAADSRAWMCRKSVGRFHGSRRSASNCVADEKNAHGKQNRDRAVAPIGDEHPIIDGAGVIPEGAHFILPARERTERPPAGQRLPRCLIFSSPGWGVAQLLENIISTATATRFGSFPFVSVVLRMAVSLYRSRGSRRPSDPSLFWRNHLRHASRQRPAALALRSLPRRRGAP
jgi:hypothetical protein